MIHALVYFIVIRQFFHAELDFVLFGYHLYYYYKKTHGEQKEYPKEDRKSEMYHKIAQMEEEKGKQTFSDAERQAEAQRRESQRSSYNNEHESELASQSIFNDDNAMRESDAQYKQSQRNNNNDEFDS